METPTMSKQWGYDNHVFVVIDAGKPLVFELVYETIEMATGAIDNISADVCKYESVQVCHPETDETIMEFHADRFICAVRGDFWQPDKLPS